MNNYTYEQRKLISDYLIELKRNCQSIRTLASCDVKVILMDIIDRKINELNTIRFGDIKNKVGIKFKVPRLHKKRIFMICNFAAEPNKKVILNTGSKAIIDPSSNIIKDNYAVEIINE